MEFTQMPSHSPSSLGVIFMICGRNGMQFAVDGSSPGRPPPCKSLMTGWLWLPKYSCSGLWPLTLTRPAGSNFEELPPRKWVDLADLMLYTPLASNGSHKERIICSVQLVQQKLSLICHICAFARYTILTSFQNSNLVLHYCHHSSPADLCVLVM